MEKNSINTLLIILLAAASFIMQSCGKDNKVAYPPAVLKGRITYNGQPVTMIPTSNDLNSTNGTQNPLQLTQTGPQPLSGGIIKLFVRNDGTFTINTFDGDYTLSVNAGKNPFKAPDPIPFSLKGEKVIDFPVTPYFWVSDYKTTFVDSVFTATFKLDKKLEEYTDNNGVKKNVNFENVTVYFNTTNLVDISGKILERSFTTSGQGVNINGVCTIKVDLKSTALTPAQNVSFQNSKKAMTGKLWANVAVKSSAAVDALYQISVALQ